MKKSQRKLTDTERKKRPAIKIAPQLNDKSAWDNAPGSDEKMAIAKRILDDVGLPKQWEKKS